MDFYVSVKPEVLFVFYFLCLLRSVKMFTSRKKIHKDKDAEPTEFEEAVAQVSYIAFCCAFQLLYSCNVSLR